MLNQPARYPEWWKGVRSVELLREGDELGLGQVSRFCWRSVLPYTLRFDLVVTRVEPPHLIEGYATGELEGSGVWRLYAGGGGTAAVYDWRVRTTAKWMNTLGPVARPVFGWNHDLVMRQGGYGLAERLGVGLLAHD